MEELTGYAAADVVGAPCRVLRGSSCRDGPCPGVGAPCPLFEHGALRDRRCVIVRRDGSRVPVLKSARLLRDEGDALTGGVEVVTDIGAVVALEREVAGLQARSGEASGAGRLLGRHPTMERLRELVRLTAESSCTVLIEGETGSGKEVVARAIHEASARRDGPFVRVSCAALPETLLEAELFGYARGAFTGAVASRAGRFEAARGGTILLDEISDVPLHVQTKLLRVLQEREVERLGENRPVRLDVRIVAATHRDLPARRDEGLFRRDLYYRLAVVPIEVPPLRARAISRCSSIGCSTESPARPGARCPAWIGRPWSASSPGRGPGTSASSRTRSSTHSSSGEAGASQPATCRPRSRRARSVRLAPIGGDPT